MSNLQSANVAGRRPWRLPLFLAGVLLFLLGPIIYAVQVNLHQLRMPWHVPILASVGVVLMAISAWQRRGVMRVIGLILFAVLCGLLWFVAFARLRAPEYTGPAVPGQQIPAFATTLANGKAFTQDDLANGSRTVVLFFRGRW